jgi:hypothetical protein
MVLLLHGLPRFLHRITLELKLNTELKLVSELPELGRKTR